MNWRTAHKRKRRKVEVAEFDIWAILRSPEFRKALTKQIASSIVRGCVRFAEDQRRIRLLYDVADRRN